MHQYKTLLTIAIMSLFSWGIAANTTSSHVYKSGDFDNFNNKLFAIAKLPTDSAEAYLISASEHFASQEGERANYLLSKSALANIYYRRGSYNKSFETICENIDFAHQIDNKLPIIELNKGLISLYKIYSKDSLALELSLQNLEIAKEYSSKPNLAPYEQKTRSDRKQSTYLAVAVQALTMERMEMAKSYLDSCYIVNDGVASLHFANSFNAQYHLQKGEYYKAMEYLEGTIEYMLKRRSGFQITIYDLYAKIYEKINQIDSAIYYYNRAIAAIDSLEVSLAGKPDILYNLANLYASRGDYNAAFTNIREAKILTDSLFTIQSQQNRNLFDIKNSYREQVEKQRAATIRQEELLEASRRSRNILIGFIILIIASSIGIFATVRLKMMVNTINEEKRNAEERSRELIETKNRELTANALQFVEKEQLISQVLEIVANKSPELQEEIKQRVHQNNNQMWEEFNMRFIQTNASFYDKLLTKHPTLTATDLKLCALLRLNFDCKEMARLLGISVGSLHVSRSRMRKRLMLNQSVNLNDYLSKI